MKVDEESEYSIVLSWLYIIEYFLHPFLYRHFQDFLFPLCEDMSRSMTICLAFETVDFMTFHREKGEEVLDIYFMYFF